MILTVFIDTNVWDWLFNHGIRLEKELPASKFRLCITREAEFEIQAMPVEKREFAHAAIAELQVTTDTYFGFGDESLPADQQRAAGFDQGRFITYAEVGFLHDQKKRISATQRPNGLYKNEADISLGARSMRAIVLTLDKKRGPLRDAAQTGGKIVFLNDYEKSGLSLADFISSYQ